jgi:hypothetical protein
VSKVAGPLDQQSLGRNLGGRAVTGAGARAFDRGSQIEAFARF